MKENESLEIELAIIGLFFFGVLKLAGMYARVWTEKQIVIDEFYILFLFIHKVVNLTQCFVNNHVIKWSHKMIENAAY